MNRTKHCLTTYADTVQPPNEVVSIDARLICFPVFFSLRRSTGRFSDRVSDQGRDNYREDIQQKVYAAQGDLVTAGAAGKSEHPANSEPGRNDRDLRSRRQPDQFAFAAVIDMSQNRRDPDRQRDRKTNRQGIEFIVLDRRAGKESNRHAPE